MIMRPGSTTGQYIPAPGEPTVFGENNNGIAIEWVSWYRHIEREGRDATSSYEIRPPNYEIVAIAVDLRKRLREELKNPSIRLPDEPPSMYTAGMGYLSLAWVMDTARRERIPPEEAVTLGMALRKM